MPLERRRIVEALEEISLLLELSGENAFKCRAYSAAARAIQRMDAGDLEERVANGTLTTIPGIGAGIAEQVASLARQGSSPLLDGLRATFPEGVRQILKLPGLGAKRVRELHEKLMIRSIDELEYACREARLRSLPGFGAKTEENVLRAIEAYRGYEGRYLLPAAWSAAEHVLAGDGTHRGRIEIAGELRRQLETIREVLFVAERPVPESKLQAPGGVPVRVITSAPEAFDACWLWESCAEEHRASLAQGAAARGLTLDGRGLRRGGTVLPADEAAIYRAAGFEPVHPLLREGRAEDAPRPASLVGPESIHGVFHVHTTESDGSGTLEEMVAEAERLAYGWIGISDHSRTAAYAGGLSADRLRAQRRAIGELQARHPRIKILHGVESDILPDGSLDYDDELLAELDFVVASVHSQMRLDGDAMTRRIERALSHPATTHWGHPTGRLLPGREPYACDMEHLLRVCARRGVSVEFNANPHRLDLDWRWIPVARALGIPISVNPDAHRPEGLADARLTVGTAAKGALSPADILNSRSAEEVLTWLRTRRKA